MGILLLYSTLSVNIFYTLCTPSAAEAVEWQWSTGGSSFTIKRDVQPHIMHPYCDAALVFLKTSFHLPYLTSFGSKWHTDNVWISLHYFASQMDKKLIKFRFIHIKNRFILKHENSHKSLICLKKPWICDHHTTLGGDRIRTTPCCPNAQKKGVSGTSSAFVLNFVFKAQIPVCYQKLF